MTALILILWMQCDQVIEQPTDVQKINGVYFCAVEVDD
jgi:hypothetical protein